MLWVLNTKFELYKVNREIKKVGIALAFYRDNLNAYKEPVGDEPTTLGLLNCIYHETNSSVKVTTGETTQYQTKKVPMLLCSYEDIDHLGIKAGDYTKLNGKRYNVTGVVNVQEWCIVADVTMEVVNDGI